MVSDEKPQKPLSPVGSIVKRRSWIVPLLSGVLILIFAVALYSISVRERTHNLLATVNGEPVYAVDIEDTIKLLPQQYQTPENRASFLNQTIDLMLLKQEAARRGILVSESEVANRIGTVLNDTGRSPQELRLILADRNLTIEDYEQLIADSLLVEKLTTETIVNHISVSEQEIVTYYQTHTDEFSPPQSGARISHIVVADESRARDIIARLNRGERFRDLAQEFSVDTASASRGGEIGVVGPTDPYPSAFLKAALSLLENQYTRTPVQTSSGYHIILRNFDLPDIQDVRSRIQQELLVEKQRAGFMALLEGLRANAVIKFYTEQGVVSSTSAASLEGFAACVGKQSVLYGAPWSESFQTQVELFKSSASLLTVVDCDAQPSVCNGAGVSKYPTWIIEKKQYGQSSLGELAERTGCSLPN